MHIFDPPTSSTSRAAPTTIPASTPGPAPVQISLNQSSPRSSISVRLQFSCSPCFPRIHRRFEPPRRNTARPSPSPSKAAAPAATSGCSWASPRTSSSRYRPPRPGEHELVSCIVLNCPLAWGRVSPPVRPQESTGAYTPPAVPAGSVGGNGQQLFSYSSLAPGSGEVAFAYGCGTPSRWRLARVLTCRSIALSCLPLLSLAILLPCSPAPLLAPSIAISLARSDLPPPPLPLPRHLCLLLSLSLSLTHTHRHTHTRTLTHTHNPSLFPKLTDHPHRLPASPAYGLRARA
jgi:hypothetical protein